MTMPTAQQKQILGELSLRAVPMEARAIAAVLECPSGSVNTQLTRLEKVNLVTHCEAGWEITEAGRECLLREASKGTIDENALATFAKQFIDVIGKLEGKCDMEVKLNLHKEDNKIEIYIAFDDMK